MSFFTIVLLVNALTFPLPPETNGQPNVTIYDSVDLYEAEPSVTALAPAEVRDHLRGLGFHPITEMKFESGRWKIRAYRFGKKRRLEVDQNTGMVIDERPDRG